jgi:hypothetical protein
MRETSPGPIEHTHTCRAYRLGAMRARVWSLTVDLRYRPSTDALGALTDILAVDDDYAAAYTSAGWTCAACQRDCDQQADDLDELAERLGP